MRAGSEADTLRETDRLTLSEALAVLEGTKDGEGELDTVRDEDEEDVGVGVNDREGVRLLEAVWEGVLDLVGDRELEGVADAVAVKEVEAVAVGVTDGVGL